MVYKKYYLVLFLIVSLSFSAQESIGATYYVDQGHSAASDGNAGDSEAAPWLTLDHATDVVVAGDTVIVKAGVYIDTDQGAAPDGWYKSFNTANSGSAGAPITFKSEPPLAAIVRSRSLPNDHSYYAWAIQDRSYIVIDGFKIEGGFIFDYSTTGSHYCTFKNSEITKSRWPTSDPSLNWAAVIGGHSSNITFNNLYVHDLDSSGVKSHNTAGILAAHELDTGNVIEYCTVDAGDIVYSAFGQKGGDSDNIIYRYNFAYNATAAFHSIGRTDDTHPSENCVYHNNIAVNVGTVFMFERNALNHTVYNNTAYNIGRFFWGQDFSSGHKFINNIAAELQNSRWGGVRCVYQHDAVTAANEFLNQSNSNVFQVPYTSVLRLRWQDIYLDLASFRDHTGFDSNSTDNYDLNFVNIGGSVPEDYKRLKYISDGQGGTYPLVRGAYLTGNETIGYHPVGAWMPTGPDIPRDFQPSAK